MATSIINFDDFFIVYDLQSIKEVFLENEFSTVLALTDVSDEDLQEMGIKALGKRRQFSAAIKDLKGKSNTCTYQFFVMDGCPISYLLN